MEEYIAALIILVVLFVGFGLTHRRGQSAAVCSGCTGCVDKSECKKENENAPRSQDL